VISDPLIGREYELARLEGMLASTRLVTLIGPGGCGKTRLALELARRLAHGRRQLNLALADLSDVTSAEQLVDRLLAALGGRERFGNTPTDVLLEVSARAPTALVLDCCEHLVGVAGALAQDLLGAAPKLTVLATSRQPLAIPAETVFSLRPLRLPEDDGGVAAIICSDAARLFVDRVSRRNREFALTPTVAASIAEICRALDGLPLAVELAAARAEDLSLQEIARGLSRFGRLAAAGGGEERPPRHRSLRASLDWSYRLLDEPERCLLRRLSCFAGGFDVPAAHAVAAPEMDCRHVGSTLDALDAKGLVVRVGEGRERRWTLLQTVAEYAAERLAADDQAELVADRHLAWFSAYAAHVDSELLEDGGETGVDRNRPNLRRALARAVERDAPCALEIAASLMRYWILGEHFREARSASAVVLVAAGEEADAAALAVVHCGAGLAAMLGEHYGEATASVHTAMRLLTGVTDSSARASCLLLSAMVLIQTGADLHGGMQNAERAVQEQRFLDDPLGLAFALVNVAMAAALCDRFDRVHSAYDEFSTITNACNHARLRTWAEHAVAWAEVTAGSPERALAHANRAISLEGQWPSMTHFQVMSFRIHALARLGRADEALDTAERAMRRARSSGAPQAIPALELALSVAQYMHGELDAAEMHARGLLKLPHLHTRALVHEILARTALIRGDLEEAQAQARQVEAVAHRTGSPRHRALVAFILGCAAIQAGEQQTGRQRLHAALATHAELGLEREAAEVLDELAILAAYSGDGMRAGRLAAAAASVRASLSCAPPPGLLERLQAAREHVSARCDPSCWDAAWAQGKEMGLAEAIAYASRRRGRRGRPPAGWASLTPAELDVAKLAASGISNPQIAAKLFIARSTVKMHLASVYRKLDVANRVELATAVVAHTSDPHTPADGPVRARKYAISSQ
jgi:predicted ATPase/DNA-binding CsgD family transcriptional regulator